jgi:tryptophan 7-halogenase
VSEQAPLQTLVIVGGGTAGWLTAAVLCQHLAGVCRVRLVESQALGTIGLGESTVPPFVALIKSLGLDEEAFIRDTGATYKLGIDFVDWHSRQSRYFHPFGRWGAALGEQDFYQAWLRAQHAGPVAPLGHFSPCQVMASAGRFWPPSRAEHTPIGGANYALHIDAAQLVEQLKTYSLARGLEYWCGDVVSVQRSAEGAIASLGLADGRQLAGDFFLDCSGFRSRILGEALDVPFEDWSAYLPCDRALAVQLPPAQPPAPYTQARAGRSGWFWHIPLQHRTGCGYVYASAFCSESSARAQLQALHPKADASSLRLLRFSTGHRRVFWRQNCVALGLAAGFIEPLEATAIHLIIRGLAKFLALLPATHNHPSLSRAYNRAMAADFAEVRDFVQLHYISSQRRDSPFWRHCADLPRSPELQERIELFRAQGVVPHTQDSLFPATSWQAVFHGMGIVPKSYSPTANAIPLAQLREQLQTLETAIASMVKRLPSHQAYLAAPPR